MGMGKTLAATVALAAMMQPAGAAPAEPPLTFKPNGSWVADFAKDQCALRRAFTSDGKTLVLDLVSFSYGDFLQIKVYSDVPLGKKPAKTRFEPDPLPKEQPLVMRLDYSDGKVGILYHDTLFPNTDLDPVSDEARDRMTALQLDPTGRDRRESEITGLLIEDAFSQDLRIQTGSLHPAMEVMRKCLLDLATTEGLDAEKIATLSRPAIANDLKGLAKSIQEKYPTRMVRKGQSAAIDIRLIVDTDGRPVDCKTLNDGQDESFSTTACERVMKEARFQPALDAQGKPVKAYWSTSIIYRIF